MSDDKNLELNTWDADKNGDRIKGLVVTLIKDEAGILTQFQIADCPEIGINEMYGLWETLGMGLLEGAKTQALVVVTRKELRTTALERIMASLGK